MLPQDLNSLCMDCFFEGTPFEGVFTPNGRFRSICNLQVYESLSVSATCIGTLLFLPDGFALASHNVVLADEYAKHGYDVYLVDYFEGDGLPIIFMSWTPGTNLESYSNLTPEEKKTIRNVDMASWLQKHNPTHIRSILLPLLSRVQADMKPGSKIYTLGHCFGGKYAISLAQFESIAAAVAFHPSFLDATDFRNLKQPLYIGCASTDVFTPNLVSNLLLGLDKSDALYKISVFGGTKHGFASRADMRDPVASENLKQSFKDSLIWFGRF